jgi:hypothetical protein
MPLKVQTPEEFLDSLVYRSLVLRAGFEPAISDSIGLRACGE